MLNNSGARTEFILARVFNDSASSSYTLTHYMFEMFKKS